MMLKPMRINSNQVRRLLRQPIGSGFLSYRYSEDTVEVVEFVISDSGRLMRTDGTLLDYVCANGDTIHYRVVSETDNASRK